MLDEDFQNEWYTTLSDEAFGLYSSTQVDLEILHSKSQLIPRMRFEFEKMDFDEDFDLEEIQHEFGYAVLIQVALHKRVDPKTIVGMTRKFFPDAENPSQMAADMLEDMVDADFVRLDLRTGRLVVIFDMPPAVQDEIDQYQFPLPMIEQPRHVGHNKQTGYRTIKGSLLMNNAHHDEDICLDHINRLNAMPLRVNEDIVSLVRNEWANLDKKKEDEEQDKFEARVRAFEKYDDASRNVLDALLAQGNRFWLTHQYDFRGRTYCRGYHVSYQSSDWNKACIEFADGEPLNAE